MHAPESCSAFCDCSCPECLGAGDHRRHAGPLELVARRLEAERDPITPQLDAELVGVRASIRYAPPADDRAREPEEDGAWDADAAYERHLEDGGPLAEVLAAEDREELERELADVGLMSLRAARADRAPGELTEEWGK